MNMNKKLFLVMFCLFFTIYSFSSDGHRSTSDESFLQEQSLRIVLQEPDPEFVLGESGNMFKYPEFWYPHGQGHPCVNGILCYPVGIVHSATAVPFVFLNHHLNFITNETVTFTGEDFPDPHYVWWRNSADPNHTFMELFYAPFFSSISVATFFLISRAFKYKISTSLFLAFLLGLTTIFFSYSQTSYNNAPSVSFILLGFLFFKMFMDNQKIFYSIISSISLVFGFMIRPDAIYVIIPLFLLLTLSVIFQKTWTLSAILHKIKKIVSFVIPLYLGYEFYRTIENMRSVVVDTTNNLGGEINSIVTTFGRGGQIYADLGHGLFGLLFSPGVGLFVYVPILLTVFFSFPDFFKKNKMFTVLFLVIPSIYIIDFGGLNSWQGFTAWSPKYLYTVIPFLLLPLGASIEKRGRIMLPIICILGGIGFFFNFVNIIQDVSWFVWSHAGGLISGLIGLHVGRSCNLMICPEITWTFQYSPLTNSIYLALTNLHLDLFLVKLVGIQYYVLTLVSVLSAQFYLLYRILKPKNISTHEFKTSTEDNI